MSAIPQAVNQLEVDQSEFDRLYITSAEVCDIMRVSRVALFAAYKNGRIPEPIRMYIKGNSSALWKRETLMPYIYAWYKKLYKQELVYDAKHADVE